MEAVHLVGRHYIEVVLYELHWEEVTAYVEVNTSPTVAWSIENGAFGDGDAAVVNIVDIGRKHLYECLVGVKETCLGVGREAYTCGAHLKEITLVA